MLVSKLRSNPKSQVLEKGYLNVYSDLNEKEKRQLSYKKRYKDINPPWDDTFVVLSNKFWELLRSMEKENSLKGVTVLDAGCGNGNYLIDEYRQEIAWAAGIDLEPDFTQKNICCDEIKYANLEEIPYEDNTFDFVFLFWVLEHLQNPGVVIKEVKRILKPGGYLLFATPNKNSLLLLAKRVLVSNSRLNLSINKKIYGREEIDTFTTFYKANSTFGLQNLLQDFIEVKIILNYDPSYTSFDDLTFRISNALDTIFERINPIFYKQHILGWAKKGFIEDRLERVHRRLDAQTS